VRRQARAFLRAIESSGFVLRYIDVNSEVTDVSAERLLGE
jgi:hypothetical protein